MSPQERSLQRAADAQRRQAIARVKQFLKLPEDRQEKSRPSLEKQYAKLTARVGKNYQVPKFEELLDDPNSWTKLEPAKPAKEGKGQRLSSLEDVVRDAYLRTLSRYPDKEESKIAISYINESESPTAGIEGLMWALVNTKEFIISH